MILSTCCLCLYKYLCVIDICYCYSEVFKRPAREDACLHMGEVSPPAPPDPPDPPAPHFVFAIAPIL